MSDDYKRRGDDKYDKDRGRGRGGRGRPFYDRGRARGRRPRGRGFDRGRGRGYGGRGNFNRGGRYDNRDDSFDNRGRGRTWSLEEDFPPNRRDDQRDDRGYDEDRGDQGWGDDERWEEEDRNRDHNAGRPTMEGRYREREPSPRRERSRRKRSHSRSASRSLSRSRSRTPKRSRPLTDRDRELGDQSMMTSSKPRDIHETRKPTPSPSVENADGEKSIRITIGNDKYKAEAKDSREKPTEAKDSREKQAKDSREKQAKDSREKQAKPNRREEETRRKPRKSKSPDERRSADKHRPQRSENTSSKEAAKDTRSQAPTKQSFLDLFLGSDSLTNFAQKLSAEKQQIPPADYQALQKMQVSQATVEKLLGSGGQELQTQIMAEARQSNVREPGRQQPMPNVSQQMPPDKSYARDQNWPADRNPDYRGNLDYRGRESDERQTARYFEADEKAEEQFKEGIDDEISLPSGASGAEREPVLPVAGIPGLEKLKNTDEEDAFLYGDDVEVAESKPNPSAPARNFGQEYSSNYRPQQQENLIRGHQESIEHRLAKGANPPAPGGYSGGSSRSQNIAEPEEKPAAEETPTDMLKNILQSIGFDFNYQKRVQEMAKNKNNKTEDNKPDSYGIKPGTSFMGGGLSKVDIGEVFNPNEDSKEEKKKPLKVLDNAESYQERARRYLEQQRSETSYSYEQEGEQSWEQSQYGGHQMPPQQQQSYHAYQQQQVGYGDYPMYEQSASDYEMRQYMEIPPRADYETADVPNTGTSLKVIQPQSEDVVQRKMQESLLQARKSNWRTVDEGHVKKPSLLEILGVKTREEPPPKEKEQPPEDQRRDWERKEEFSADPGRDWERKEMEYSEDPRREWNRSPSFEKRRGRNQSPQVAQTKREPSFSPDERRRYQSDNREQDQQRWRRDNSRSPPRQYRQEQSQTRRRFVENPSPPRQYRQEDKPQRRRQDDSVSPSRQFRRPDVDDSPPRQSRGQKRGRSPYASPPRQQRGQERERSPYMSQRQAGRNRSPVQTMPRNKSPTPQERVKQTDRSPSFGKKAEAMEGRLAQRQAFTNEEKQLLLHDMEKRRDLLFDMEEELENLRSKQNELMRRKQRQQDGHRDPELLSNMQKQERLMEDIAKLRMTVTQACIDEAHRFGQPTKQQSKESAAAAQQSRDSSAGKRGDKRSAHSPKRESPAEKAERRTIVVHESQQKERYKEEEVPEKRSIQVTRTIKTEERRPKHNEKEEKKPSKQTSKKESVKTKSEIKQEDSLSAVRKFDFQFEYYDAGNHFCRYCNHIARNVEEMLLHVSSQSHLEMFDISTKPWRKNYVGPRHDPGLKTVMAPIKGVEFIVGVPQAFYCMVCSHVACDPEMALDHLKSEAHSDKYRKYIDDNPQHEKLQTLGRQAALSVRQDIAMKEEAVKKRKASQQASSKTAQKSQKETESRSRRSYRKSTDGKGYSSDSSSSSSSSRSRSRSNSRKRSTKVTSSSSSSRRDKRQQDSSKNAQDKNQKRSDSRSGASTSKKSEQPPAPKSDTLTEKVKAEAAKVEEQLKRKAEVEAARAAAAKAAQEQKNQQAQKQQSQQAQERDRSSSPEIDKIADLAAEKPKKAPFLEMRIGVGKQARVQAQPPPQPVGRSSVKFPFIGKAPFLRKKPGGKSADSEDKSDETKTEDSSSGSLINIKFKTTSVEEKVEKVAAPKQEEPEVIIRERPTRPPPAAVVTSTTVESPTCAFKSSPAGKSLDFDSLPISQSLDSIPIPVGAGGGPSPKEKAKEKKEQLKRTLEDMQILGLDPSDTVMKMSDKAKEPPRLMFGPPARSGKESGNSKTNPKKTTQSDDIFPDGGDLTSLQRDAEKKAAWDAVRSRAKPKTGDALAEFELLDECQ